MKPKLASNTLLDIVVMCAAVVLPGCKDDSIAPPTLDYEWVDFYEDGQLVLLGRSCITIDAQGNKWIGTYDGISVLKTK